MRCDWSDVSFARKRASVAVKSPAPTRQRHRQRDLCDEQAAPERVRTSRCSPGRGAGIRRRAPRPTATRRRRPSRGQSAAVSSAVAASTPASGVTSGNLESREAGHERRRHDSDDPPRERHRTGERHGRQQDSVDAAAARTRAARFHPVRDESRPGAAGSASAPG